MGKEEDAEAAKRKAEIAKAAAAGEKKTLKLLLKGYSTREAADKRTQENNERLIELVKNRNEIEINHTKLLQDQAQFRKKYDDDIKKANQDQIDFTAKFADAIAKGDMDAATAAFKGQRMTEDKISDMQEIKKLNDDHFKTITETYEQDLKRNDTAEEYVKLLQKAGDEVDDLVESYMEELEFLGEIDTFIKKIPGGALISKLFGFEDIEKKIREKVVKSLMDAQVAGKGLGAILGKAAGALLVIGALVALGSWLLEADTEMVKLAKDMDISKSAAIGLEKSAHHIADEMSVIGVRGKDVVATFVALKAETGLNYEELQKTNAAAKDVVATTTLLMTKVGLTATETEGFHDAAIATGVEMSTLTAAAQSMGDEVMSSKDLMKEVGKVSKGVLNTFRNNPAALLKAVKHAKMLGTTLEEAHTSGKKLLDVESSMEAEMTANVLTGKHINMNKARELALMGKTDEYLEEVDKQMGSAADYAKMLPFQQEAFAEGLGKSKEALDGIMANKEKLEKLGVTQAQLDAKMKLTGKDREAEMQRMLSLKGEDAAAELQKQYALLDQNDLTQKFSDSMSEITDGVKSALLPLLNGVSKAMSSIAQFAQKNTFAFGAILAVVTAIAAAWIGMAAVKAIKGKIADFKDLTGIGKKEATPEAQSFKAAKGSNKGLEDMSKGLQSMGQGGVEQGAANLKSAGPGLMAANMSKKFLKFIGQTKLKELETNFKSLSEGLKNMADTKSGSASLLIYGVAALIANLGNGFTKFMGQTKLKELATNFTALAEGLKKMSGTAGGSLSLGLFGIAAIPALISIPFLLFIGKVELPTLEYNFTALAEGLKKMADTKMGSLALGIFGVAGVIAIPSLIFLATFGKVELPTLETNFTSLAAGLTLMADTKMGSLALGIFGVAGALAILSMPFLLVFGKVELTTLGSNFTALSTGLNSMASTFVGSAALLLFAVAGALAIPSLIFLGGIALIGVAAAAGLTALGTGLLALGTVAATGLPFIAVALIAALGISMIPFAFALNLATPAIEAFGNVMVKVFEGLALIIGAVADGISKIIRTVAESIKSLATLNGPNMIAVAAGIVALGLAIAGFGGGSLIGGALKGLGDLLGGDPAENFKKFESINGAKLLQTASAILALSAAIKQFSSLINADQLDSVSNAIDKLIDSLSNFEAAADSIKQVGISISTFVSLINVDQLNSVSTAIDKLAISLSNFGSLINAAQLNSVSTAIDKLAKSLSNFGASAAAGGLMGAIGKFFDEDPVEKFNRFAKIDSNKLIEVASAIDKLGAAFKNFSESVSNVGDTSGITNTIDKVLELHDAITKSPLEKVMEEVVSGVGNVFSTAGKWVASVIPGLESIDSEKSKESASAAPNPNSEVVAVLNKILAATSSPVKINIGSKVIEEIGRITSLNKTYTGKIDQSYGANG